MTYCHNCANTGRSRCPETGQLERCTYCARPPKAWVVWLSIFLLSLPIVWWIWLICKHVL